MEKVKVFLRLKGGKEEQKGIFSDNSVVDGKTVYEFDKVFCGKDQVDLYKSISPLVKIALDGGSLSVFAYGQTGSGKTYTMEGTEEAPGVIPRVIEEVFSSRAEKRIVISIVEIYNEKVSDMVNPENVVTIREKGTSIVADSLSQVECKTKEEAFTLFKKGVLNRKTYSNSTNPTSSRSHLIFTIQTEALPDAGSILSKITLVDLAGSERMEIDIDTFSRVKRSKTDRNLETSSINKSLLYLGRIIHALSQKAEKVKHINYRDSKLTFFLRDSLNGLSMLAIIGAVNTENETETKNTLKFLSTAKEVKLSPQNISEEKKTQHLISQIEYLRKENINLENSLSSFRTSHPGYLHIQRIDNLISSLDTLLEQTNAIQVSIEKVGVSFSSVQKESNSLSAKLFSSLYEYRKKEIEEIDTF